MPHYTFKIVVNLKLALVRLKKNFINVPYCFRAPQQWGGELATPAISLSPYRLVQAGLGKRQFKDQQKITKWLHTTRLMFPRLILKDIIFKPKPSL